MAQYPKVESIASIGSIILAILEVQEVDVLVGCSHRQDKAWTEPLRL